MWWIKKRKRLEKALMELQSDVSFLERHLRSLDDASYGHSTQIKDLTDKVCALNQAAHSANKLAKCGLRSAFHKICSHHGAVCGEIALYGGPPCEDSMTVDVVIRIPTVRNGQAINIPYRFVTSYASSVEAVTTFALYVQEQVAQVRKKKR
jgi:hypothetical protein